MACLGAIEQLGWPLDRIVTAEVWATDTIPADLPPMMEFKKKADAIIKERWGIEVEHLYATRNGTKLTYEKLFYHIPKRRVKKGFENGSFSGFPYQKGAWCNDRLKTKSLDSVANTIDGFQRHGGVRRNQPAQNRSGSEVCSDSQSSEAHGAPGDSNRVFSASSVAQGADRNIVQYLGIAADEPKRFHNLTEYKKSPLVELGWTEADCRKWCEENDLLSPIYESSNRGGAGSVTTKGWANFASSGTITRNCGPCCSNGTTTVLYRLSRRQEPCQTE